MADQASDIDTATKWVAALGGSYKGWIGGLAFVYGESVKAQMKPFKDAAKKGKGLTYTYIAHFSNGTTDTYSTNY